MLTLHSKLDTYVAHKHTYYIGLCISQCVQKLQILVYGDRWVSMRTQ